MDDRHKSARTLPIGVALISGMLSIGLGVLWFLQTREPMPSLILIAVVPWALVTLGFAWWASGDAPNVGLPTWPWTAAILLVPGLGIVAYLISREVTDRR